MAKPKTALEIFEKVLKMADEFAERDDIEYTPEFFRQYHKQYIKATADDVSYIWDNGYNRAVDDIVGWSKGRRKR